MSALATGTSARTGCGPAPGVVRQRRRQPATPMAFDAMFDRGADVQTFDDVIASAWEGLSAHRTVTCPVCHRAAMRPRSGSGTGAHGPQGSPSAGGCCADCGTELA